MFFKTSRKLKVEELCDFLKGLQGAKPCLVFPFIHKDVHGEEEYVAEIIPVSYPKLFMRGELKGLLWDGPFYACLITRAGKPQQIGIGNAHEIINAEFREEVDAVLGTLATELLPDFIERGDALE